jgi:hypothetical protein
VRPAVRVVIPASDGARLAAIYRLGEVIGREHIGEDVALTVRVEPWQLERLRNGGNGASITAQETGQ